MSSEVKIKAANGISYQASVCVLGAELPAAQAPGPDATWTFQLDPEDYDFNVDIEGVAGATVTFTFTGGTPKTATSFVLAGTPGQVVGSNEDIEFTVP